MKKQFLFALVLAWVVGAPGFVVAGPFTTAGTQPPVTYALLPSGNCRGCHGFDYDPVNYIEPGDTWTGSMHAQAARDPLFWAALDVANRDVPNIGDFCLRCHVPVGWLNGRSEPPAGSTDGCRLVGSLDQFPGTDFGGVTCHVCHRMMVNESPPPGQQAAYLENAQFWIDDQVCPGRGEPCRHGPYDYQTPGEVPAPHAWAYSAYHESSDLCGNCHNVTNPALNLIDAGTDTGLRFPIERTHREWQASAYAIPGPERRECQDCHMPDATVDPAYPCYFADNNRTGNMAIHEFVGGNTWIPDVLRQEYPALGLSTELAATRDLALGKLQQQAADVEIVVPGQATPGTTLGVEVKVTNRAGHKLPTGYPEGRRMWLHVVARDGTGTTFWESGAYDIATGALTQDEALKVYQAVVGVFNRNGTSTCDSVDGLGAPIFHFARNDCIVRDDRIPPLGFSGGGNVEIRPVGYSYPETTPGSGILVNYDVTSYAIPIPLSAPSPIRVSATLRYQTASREYVSFLRDQATENGFPNDCIPRTTGTPTKSRGALLYDMWSRNGRSAPVDVGSATGVSTIAPTPGEASRSMPMRVTGYDHPSGNVTLAYDPACGGTDHTAYIGGLAEIAARTYSEQACGLGATGSATIHLGDQSYFWVIVGNDGTHEGSYGKDSRGLERPEDTLLLTCGLLQDLAHRCDP